MSESLEKTGETGTDLDALVAELDSPFGVLPEKAIVAARLHQERMIPRLIALIEEATRVVQEGRTVDTNGHFFALFLLAEFRAREALPAIVSALSLPGEGPFDLFADAITEDLPRILPSLTGAE